MADLKPGTFILNNVRLSFPDLFTAVDFDNNGKFNYRAAFLIPKGNPQIAQIEKLRETLVNEKFAGNKKKPPSVALAEIVEGGANKSCFINGDSKAYDGYAGMMVVSAIRSKESGPVMVVDRNPSVKLSAEDGRPYAGCYVNAKVSFWVQDNQFGAGFRCSLESVQFVRDGDAFSAAGPATADGFSEVAEEDPLMG